MAGTTAGTRVGIIGMGWVGSSVAISTLHAGVARELLLNDLRVEVAEGEAMDLAQGTTFYPPASVRVASVEEMHETDAVVVAVGNGAMPGGKSRLDQLKQNAGIVRSLGERLRGYGGLILLVTNPVDALTVVMAQSTGLPPERVIGTGTLLDSARLRQMIGETLQLDARSVHAYVVGEHGDSEVVLWSTARVGATPLAAWPGWKRDDETRIAEQVRTAGYDIVQRKGATNHAIGLVTAHLLRGILRGERQVLTVSRVQSDVPRFSDVALSLPAVVGADGATKVVVPEMTPAEREGLERSAGLLRSALGSL